MNYEMAKRAAMRGETVRRMDWGIRGVYIDGAIWRFREAPQTPCNVTPLDKAATNWVIVRKRPKSERDVFTHPRRGDVLENKAIGDLEVLAVAPEGVLWQRADLGSPCGETRAYFASRRRNGWTVKTRAPARKS